MISTILTVLSAVITIYTILCLIDILMSWIPGLKFTGFGRFISQITEPYLGLFSRMSFLHIGNLDFSPIIAIGILALLSSILSGIIRSGRIFFGGILATILSQAWSICSSLLVILFLLMIIRWIVLLKNKGVTDYNSGWYAVDNMLQKFVYKIGRTFVKTNLSYQKAVLISWIVTLVAIIVGNILFNILANLCYMLPF